MRSRLTKWYRRLLLAGCVAAAMATPTTARAYGPYDILNYLPDGGFLCGLNCGIFDPTCC